MPLGGEERFDLMSQENCNRQTPAHLVAMENKNCHNLKSVIESLDWRAGLNLMSMRDSSGNTPLHIASESIGQQGIKSLFKNSDLFPSQNGNVSNRRQNEHSNRVINEATSKNQEVVVNALLSEVTVAEHMDILGRTDEKGRTPMHTAVINSGNKKLLAALTQNLPSKNRVKLLKKLDNEGCSPLHRACFGSRKAETLRALLKGLSFKEKSDLLNMKDGDGDTAITLAMAEGPERTEVMKMLNDWKFKPAWRI